MKHILAFLFFAATISFSQSVVQTIPLPNTTYWNLAYGIASDGSFLYVTSNTSTTSLPNYGFIYKLDLNGNIVDSIITHQGESQGVAFDGTF